MSSKKLLTSEAVGCGHPDIIADTISDTILDSCLSKNRDSRVAVETMVSGDLVHVAGEISGVELTNEEIFNAIKNAVHHVDSDGITLFKTDKFRHLISLRQQSAEISMGVDTGGAGDQGLMFGFSCDQNQDMLPMPIHLARRLANYLTVNHNSTFRRPAIQGIYYDCKTQFTIEYDEVSKTFGKIHSVVCSIHHSPTWDINDLRKQLKDAIVAFIEPLYPQGDIKNVLAENWHINATGAFTVGGPDADTGLTGRKLIAATYGGMAHHGGGALCVAKNSRVNTSDGLIKLGDCESLIGKHLVKTDVHPEVMGAFWNNGVKNTILLETNDGYELEATPDHMIRVLNSSGQYVWKELQNVTKTDAIAIQRQNRMFGDEIFHSFKFKHKKNTTHFKKIVVPKTVTRDICELMGWWTGDGNGTGDYISIAFNGKDDELGNHISRLFKNCFGIEGNRYGHWIQMNSLEARAFLHHLGCDYKRAWDKEVPDFIWKTTRENVAAYLRGCFETDGCIRVDKGRRVGLTYITTSKLLAKQIQQLLLNFGITSHIGVTTKLNKSTMKDGTVIQGRRASYVVSIVGGNSYRIFSDEIGFSYQRKKEILRASRYNIRSNHYDAMPNILGVMKELWRKLPQKVQHQYSDFGRLFRATSDAKKATKNVSYEKLHKFIEYFQEYLGGDEQFMNLSMLSAMNHHWVTVKSTVKSFAEVCDINVPESHTFTANGFVVHNSGKDSSKVDRSAAMYLRWLANRIVKQEKLAGFIEIQVGYAIGVAKPMNVSIIQLDNVENTAKIEEFLREQDYTPNAMIEQLKLKEQPYVASAMYGPFGRQPNNFVYSWENV